MGLDDEVGDFEAAENEAHAVGEGAPSGDDDVAGQPCDGEIGGPDFNGPSEAPDQGVGGSREARRQARGHPGQGSRGQAPAW